MGTLSSELAPLAAGVAEKPRVYADANVPNGVVAYMRERLAWDVLFVLEHDDLRRARDIEHYRLARQLGRTLVTLDHDYLDDRRFPPGEGAGVIVLSAPDERWLRRLLKRTDRDLFRSIGARALPLEHRKLEIHIGALNDDDIDADAGD
jgi:predicted nuclease of predicted toxin-antitoxin system